jgi:hypothetical protein
MTCSSLSDETDSEGRVWMWWTTDISASGKYTNVQNAAIGEIWRACKTHEFFHVLIIVYRFFLNIMDDLLIRSARLPSPQPVLDER